MTVVFERSGGFAGFRDVLTLEGNGLTLTRRGTQVAQRPLSGDESGRLASLVNAAKGAPALPPSTGRTPDGFNFSVTVDGEKKVQLNAPSSPEAADGPWQALTAWLDELLAAEIQRAP
jgi:hypothetical protein